MNKTIKDWFFLAWFLWCMVSSGSFTYVILINAFSYFRFNEWSNIKLILMMIALLMGSLSGAVIINLWPDKFATVTMVIKGGKVEKKL